MHLIDMKGIVRRFRVGSEHITVLPGVDFYVDRGEFLSVVGASGSGKSTLMNIIGLLDRPNAGSYLFDGVNVLESSSNELAEYRAKKIGFVFQSFNLIGRATALANVEVPLMYAGVPRSERAQRAEYLLEQVGMADRMKHMPNELSGGQKQRVAIARALANNPDIILADEPTGALDSSTGYMVMDLFHHLNENEGRTIIFITHNPALAQETGRTVVLQDGKVISNTVNEKIVRVRPNTEENPEEDSSEEGEH